MKRLLAHLTAKAMGLPSVEEYAAQNLAMFLDANDISEPELTCYKIDRDRLRPHLYHRVYVGRAKHLGRLVALVVSCDEDTGFTHGGIFDPEDAHRHRLVVSKYKSAGAKYDNLFDAFSMEWRERPLQLKNSTQYG